MDQNLRPAVKNSELAVAIIAQFGENIEVIERKLYSFNIKNVSVKTEKSIEKDMELVVCKVAVIYAGYDNAFLFNAILAIKNKYNMPTLVMSRNYDEFTAVLALELGADEYLPSQVGANELRLRVLRLFKKVESRKAPQTKASTPKKTVDDADPVNLNSSAFGGARVTYYSFFTPYEFEVLLLLAGSTGKAIARDTISLAVRGRSTNKTDRSIDNIIARVRKKLIQLGFSKYLIRGIHSFGYIFTGDGKRLLDELEEAIKKKEHGM